MVVFDIMHTHTHPAQCYPLRLFSFRQIMSGSLPFLGLSMQCTLVRFYSKSFIQRSKIFILVLKGTDG